MKQKIISWVVIAGFVFSLFYSSTIIIARSQTVFYPLDLVGKRIYVDPGHGGKDNGASYLDVVEDEINLHISLKLVEHLVHRGAIVEISRVGDYDLASLYATNRKREDLRKRAEAIKAFAPDLFLSIHVNSYPSDHSVSGGQVFYRYHDKTSALAADFVQAELNLLNNTNKSAKQSDFYFFEHTSTKGLLVETGFITSSKDRKKLLDPPYQHQISKALLDGIVNYFLAS